MSTNIPDIEETLLAENVRLRARIDALEAELGGAKAGQFQGQSESERLQTDNANRVANEARHVVHAVTLAFAEQLRASADIISSVANEMWRPREDRSDGIRE